jgi:hypothetical protein
MAAYAYQEWPGNAFPFAVAFNEFFSIEVAASPDGQAKITAVILRVGVAR